MAGVSEARQSVARLLEGLSGRTRLVLGIAAAALSTVLLVYLFWAPAEDSQVLYSNLTEQDAGEVVAKLKERGVPYELTAGGSAVLVPSSKVYELRLSLASEGLPRGGNVGFEIFNQQSLGMTEFVEKLNYQRALQGELVRTIRQFSEVEDARVHIVMSKESVFLDESEPASAAVMLKMRPGRTLSQRQVEGVVHLVSASVSGLKPDNVKVVDMAGRTLFAREEEGSTGALTSSQLEYQRNLEDGLKRKVEGILEKVVGPGKVIARISADLDFTQQSLTHEIFDPEGAVPRSRQSSQESSSGGTGLAGGIPGPDYDANQPGAGATDEEGGPSSSRTQETVNYEISKLAKQVVAPVGTIERLSVAVILDGVYKEGASGGEKSFVPRSKKEIDEFGAIVKRAVGFDEERGDQVEVTSIPFALPEEIPEPGFLASLPSRFVSTDALKWLGKLALAIVLILFVLRPLASGLAKGGLALPGGGGARPQLPAGSPQLQLAMNDTETLDTRQQAMLLARTEPEKTAELVRTWLTRKE
jgi:flagellar M-ring protein FliF